MSSHPVIKFDSNITLFFFQYLYIEKEEIVSDCEINIDSDSDTDDTTSNKKEETVHVTISSDSESDFDRSDTWMTIGNVQLKHDEEAILRSNDMWLNDLIINAAQHLLKVQFPHVGGFQDTILQKTLSFQIENGEFVQVLNKGGNHWITVTTIGVNNLSSVRVFDSLGSSKCDFEM